MGYTEQNLGKNEIIIMKGEINKASMTPNIIFGGLILLNFVPSGIWVMFTGDGLIGFITVLIGLLLSLPIILVKLYSLKSNELSLTSKKIIGKTGIISTKVMVSPLDKINSISVEQGLGGKLFGYGRIIIATSAGTYKFDYISHADVFRSTVMNQIEEYDEEKNRKQAEQLAYTIKQ